MFKGTQSGIWRTRARWYRSFRRSDDRNIHLCGREGRFKEVQPRTGEVGHSPPERKTSTPGSTFPFTLRTSYRTHRTGGRSTNLDPVPRQTPPNVLTREKNVRCVTYRPPSGTSRTVLSNLCSSETPTCRTRRTGRPQNLVGYTVKVDSYTRGVPNPEPRRTSVVSISLLRWRRKWSWKVSLASLLTPLPDGSRSTRGEHCFVEFESSYLVVGEVIRELNAPSP